MSRTEIAWQTMHAVDVAETVNDPARDECSSEGGSARFLIGNDPRTETVLAWGVAIGVAHYAFDRWLHETGRASKPSWRVPRWIDVGYKGFTVSRNHELGVRPFGEHRCPWR